MSRISDGHIEADSADTDRPIVVSHVGGAISLDFLCKLTIFCKWESWSLLVYNSRDKFYNLSLFCMSKMLYPHSHDLWVSKTDQHFKLQNKFFLVVNVSHPTATSSTASLPDASTKAAEVNII